MSTKEITYILDKQLKLHKSLLAIAERKTDIIKKESIGELTDLLKDEQVHLTAISVLEKERLIKWNTASSLSDIAEAANEKEKEKLESLKLELLTCIEQLKAVNELNQQLLMQSLQFVHLNLDMLRPQRDTDTYNYSQKEQPSFVSTSVFNSKA